jgi:hypothetical protein
MPCLI